MGIDTNFWNAPLCPECKEPMTYRMKNWQDGYTNYYCPKCKAYVYAEGYGEP